MKERMIKRVPYLLSFFLLLLIACMRESGLKEIGFCDTPYWAINVYVSDSYAYVGNTAKMQIIDVSDPKNPQEISCFPTKTWVDGIHPYAYIVCCTTGLRIIDISKPQNPKEVGHYTIPERVLAVYVLGSYAYLSTYIGIRIIDISAPQQPKEAGYCDIPGIPNDIYVSDSYAYIVLGMPDSG